jgi:hypothetical protein
LTTTAGITLLLQENMPKARVYEMSSGTPSWQDSGPCPVLKQVDLNQPVYGLERTDYSRVFNTRLRLQKVGSQVWYQPQYSLQMGVEISGETLYKLYMAGQQKIIQK